MLAFTLVTRVTSYTFTSEAIQCSSVAPTFTRGVHPLPDRAREQTQLRGLGGWLSQTVTRSSANTIEPTLCIDTPNNYTLNIRCPAT